MTDHIAEKWAERTDRHLIGVRSFKVGDKVRIISKSEIEALYGPLILVGKRTDPSRDRYSPQNLYESREDLFGMQREYYRQLERETRGWIVCNCGCVHGSRGLPHKYPTYRVRLTTDWPWSRKEFDWQECYLAAGWEYPSLIDLL